MKGPQVVLVLDEHLTALRGGLESRGIRVRTVADFGVQSTLDPDVIRGVARKMRAAPWVLVTMDVTIVEEYPRFDWDRYAIAWIVIDPYARGIAVEHAKTNVVQRHAHQIVEQRPPDHFSYTASQRHRHPPALVSAQKRSDPFREHRG